MMPPSESRPQTRWEDEEYVLSRVQRDGRARLLVRSRFGERPEILARLEHVYELRDELDPSWATRPVSLVRGEGGDALLLEDPGGEVLSTLLGRPWELRAFLRVAIGIAAALRELHKQGIIHKDVQPAHVLVEIGTGKAWLTGFYIAIGSGMPQVREAFEMNEMQFFNAWPLKVLMALLVEKFSDPMALAVAAGFAAIALICFVLILRP